MQSKVNAGEFRSRFQILTRSPLWAIAPAAARGACPILFGDFKRGYLIGDRGGSELKMQLLDQTKALQALVSVLTFRRTDGRVRCAGAIQPYNVAAS